MLAEAALIDPRTSGELCIYRESLVTVTVSINGNTQPSHQFSCLKFGRYFHSPIALEQRVKTECAKTVGEVDVGEYVKL